MSDLTNIPKQTFFKTTLASPITAVQTADIVLSSVPGYTPSGETIYFSILDPDNPEVISCTGWNSGTGILTGVTRGVSLIDGVAGAGAAHGSGVGIVMSDPFNVYKDIQTAVNSKADKIAPTISNLTVTGFIDLPTYANAAARDVALPTPAEGYVVVLLDDGQGNRAFSVYNGSSWGFISAPLADVTVTGFLNVSTGYLKVPVYANDAARDAGVPSPAFGMVIWNTVEDTLEIYTSSGWAPLDLGTVTPIATTTLAGKARLATDALAISRTDTSGGEPVVLQPSHLEFASIIEAIAEEDLTANDLVGVSTCISQSDLYVSKAGKDRINVTLPSVADEIRKVIALDNTRLFVLYQTTSGNLLSGVVLTYDQATNSVTAVGSKVDFASAALVGPTAMAVDLIAPDKVAVTYVYSATNTVIRVKPATISGAVITLGAEQTLVTLGTTYQSSLQITNIGTDKAVVYAASSTPANSRVTAFSVSGTTITAGAGATPTSNLRDAPYLVKLDTDKFALIDSDAATGYANVGTVATVTTTLSSEQTFTTGGTTASDTAASIAIATDKIITTYNHTGSSTASRMVCITVSGTTITANTPVTISNVSDIALCKTSDNNFLFRNNTGDRVFEGSVSGSTITLTPASYFPDMFALSSINRAGFTVVNGRVIGSANTGAGTTALPLATQGMAYTFIGQVLATTARGAACNVKLKNIPIGNMTGLRGGEFYSIGQADMSISDPGDYNGTLTMVDPLTNAGSAAFLPINNVMLALKEDTIVAL